MSFPVESELPNRCVVVKDAGDDPDCTDGARLTAAVEWATAGARSTDLRAGAGVGTITKPGIGLAVGAPAINPVPQRMILTALGEVTERPLVVTFAVPGGEAMAEKTTNARLGIVGGISILGTTGIVRPFSTAAYRASVVQQIDVAAAQGERTVMLATGSRSERAAMRLHPGLDDVCCVEVGDFTGIALRRAAAAGVERVVFVGMAGKIAKLAAGVMMTHFHRSKVDGEVLAAAARGAGAPAVIVDAATETETARHFFEVCVAHGALEPAAASCASRQPRRAGSTSTARSRSRSSWSTSTARRLSPVPERIAVVGVSGGEPVGKEARAAVEAATVVAGAPATSARSLRSAPAPCRSTGR